METKIYNNKSDKLILVFAGWGMDYNVFSHLKAKDYDVIVCYNYTRLDFDLCEKLGCQFDLPHPECPLQSTFKQYREIYLIAWGCGVWAASITFDRYLQHLKMEGRFRTLRLMKKIRKSVAINGTLFPISSTWGINQQVFNNTLKAMEAEVHNNVAAKESITLQKFTTKMCGTKGILDKYMAQTPQRALEDIYNELVAVKENFIFSNAIFWNKIIICDRDSTIPAKNQARFWETYEINIDSGNRLAFNAENFKIEHFDTYHYPFFKWSCWDDILK